MALLAVAVSVGAAQMATDQPSWSSFPFSASVPNDNVIGTSLYYLAKLTSAGTAMTLATTDRTGVLGIVVQNAGRIGSPIIAAGGEALCVFDGASEAGDYVQSSMTIPGGCHDAGSTFPSSGDVVGRVVISNPLQGTFPVLVSPPSHNVSTGTATTATSLAGTPSTCNGSSNQIALGIQANGNAICNSLPNGSASAAGILQLGTSAATAAAGNDSRIVNALQSSSLGQPSGPAQLDTTGKFPWINLNDVPVGSASAAGILQLGSTATTAAAGNDSRIVNALQSSSLGQPSGPAQLDSTGKFPWTNLNGVPVGSAGAAGILQLGTTSTTAAAGNDSRIVNALQSSSLGQPSGPAQLDSTGKFPWTNLNGVPVGSAAAAGILQLGTTAATAAAGNDSRIVNALQSSSLGQPSGPAQLDTTGKFPWTNLNGVPVGSASAAGILQLGMTAATAAAGNDSRIVNALQSSSLGQPSGPAQLDSTGKYPWANLDNTPAFGSAALQNTNAFDTAGTATAAVAAIPQATGAQNGLLKSSDWATFNSKQSALGIVNVKDYGATGNGSTDDTANVQAALNAAAAANEVAYFPYGTYNVSTPLEVESAVRCAEQTIIKLTASGSAVMRVGSTSAVVDGFMKGCILNANALGTDGLILRQYQHFQLDDTEVLNAITNMFHFGDSTLSGSSYEAIAKGIHARHTLGTMSSASVGLFIDSNATDSNVSHSVLSGIATGVKAMTGGNFFTDIHVWTASSAGWMVTGFDDYGVGNLWKGCESDTAQKYGFHGESTSSNNVILGGRFYNNNIYGQDNAAIGVQLDNPAPYATITGNLFQGADSTHRMATDIVVTTATALYATTNTDVNVVNQSQVGFNVNGLLSVAGNISGMSLMNMIPTTSATATANQTTTMRLNASYWNGSSPSLFSWNINVGIPSSGYANTNQLYFYTTGATPNGIIPTIMYGANAATSSANNSSMKHCYQGSYYASGAQYDQWCVQNVLGTGTAPYSQLILTHQGTSGAASFAFPAATINSDYTMSNAPRLVWSTYGNCSPQTVNCYESALWTPGKPIRITQWTVNFQTDQAGCTTYPVISIVQGSTILTSITTSPATSDLTGSGFPLLVNPASGALRVVITTAGVGCTNYGSGISSNIEYSMQ